MRSCRGKVRASITCIEKKIALWEEQESLTDADRCSAVKMPERLMELTKEFKTYHVSVIDQTKGDEALEEEQRTLDAFEDKIEELNDRLELLVGPPMGMEPPVGTRPFTTERTDEERRTTIDVLADVSSVVKGLVEAQKEHGPSLETRAVETGVRIPKIEVPTFNGNVLEWNLFGSNLRFPSIPRFTSVMLRSLLTFDRQSRTARTAQQDM